MSRLKKIIRSIIRRLPIHKVSTKIVELSPNELLIGRSALITGGTRGIGLEIAKSFVKSGATVVITGRNQNKIDKVVSQLKQELSIKDRIYGVEMNVKCVSDIPKVIENTINLLPEKKIDILVNNAGVTGDHIATTTEDMYNNILDTNLKGVFFLCQHFAHYLKEKKIKGNILNIASSSSIRPANSAYGVSKWGVRGLTEGLARSLAPYGITVNAIAPGQTATSMMAGVSTDNIYHPKNLIGRYILPTEIANMAVILVSDMGKTIIGDTIYMTGGSGNVTNEDLPYDF